MSTDALLFRLAVLLAPLGGCAAAPAEERGSGAYTAAATDLLAGWELVDPVQEGIDPSTLEVVGTVEMTLTPRAPGWSGPEPAGDPTAWMSQYGAQFLGPERWQASDTFVPIADGSADLLDPATGDFDPRPCPRFGDAELRAQCEARVRASCGLEPPVPCQWDQAKMVIAALQARGDARVRPGVLVEQGLLEPSRAAEGGGSLGPVLGYMLPAGSQVARRTRGGGGRVKLVALLITAVVIGAHYLSDTSAPNPPGGDDDDRRRCPPITPSSSTGWAIGETVPVTVCADDLGVHTSVVGVRYRSDGGEGATSLLFSNVGVKPVLAGAVSLQPGFQTPVTIQVTSREQLLSLTSPGSAPASISYRTGGGLFDR